MNIPRYNGVIFKYTVCKSLDKLPLYNEFPEIPKKMENPKQISGEMTFKPGLFF
jgi:hypothetical protein